MAIWLGETWGRQTALVAGLFALALGPTAASLAQTETAGTASAAHDAPAIVAGKAWLEINKITDVALFAAALRELWPTLPGTPDQWIAAEGFRTPKSLSAKAYRWLDREHGHVSALLKDMKDQINDTASHASIYLTHFTLEWGKRPG